MNPYIDSADLNKEVTYYYVLTDKGTLRDNNLTRLLTRFAGYHATDNAEALSVGRVG